MPPQPASANNKRILSLDGGGVRGIVEVAFLAEIEAVLAARTPQAAQFRLRDYFHLIGGTSTGSIIAAALSLGRSASEIKALYEDLAPKVFRRDWRRITGIQSRFSAKPLATVLRQEIGDIRLDDVAIKPYLGLVTKRLDTGSPWIVSNIPTQPYWNDPEDKSYLGNRHYMLASLIRASTAAPYFFGPERIAIASGIEPGVFVDGAVSPYNDPSLPLLMLATLSPFGLKWPLARDKLLLISIGTGAFRTTVASRGLSRKPAGKFALDALCGLIGDCQAASQTLLQWMAYSPAPWMINSELGTLQDDFLAGAPLFTYQRYDVRLERDWLASVLEINLSDRDLARLRMIDDPGIMSQLLEIATLAARKQVRAEHFEGFPSSAS